MPVHYMQTKEWAEVKSAFGWKHTLLPSSVIVYSRSVPTMGKLHYLPGVNGLSKEGSKEFTAKLKRDLHGGFVLRMEPYQPYDEALIDAFKLQGWKKAKQHVQYRHTVLVNLKPSEEDIWMSFKSRGRYEVLQAKKSGVVINDAEPSDENLAKMYELMQTTSERNKFYIRDKKFTFAYWHKFREAGKLKLFFARHDEDLLSGSVILTNENLAWYKDGGSTRLKSNLMAARFLQWEAMKVLKAEGIESYDLGGIPNPSEHVNSSMHGLYVFKSAFSKDTHSLMPTLELSLNIKYKLWPKAEKQWLRAYNLFARSLWW